ncbi:MAG: hypothetical protein V4544_00180 [Pseudomonadota bacterium]
MSSISSTLPLFISAGNIKSLEMKEIDTAISETYDRMKSPHLGTFLDCDAAIRISGQEKIAEIKGQKIENIRQLERQKKISQQLNDVQKIASDLRQLINSIGPDGRTKESLNEEVKGFISQIQGIMNRDDHGNQTLAGKELKGKSVNIKDLPEIKSGQGLDYSYYTGESGNDQSIKINDYLQVDLYPITGKHDAFAKTIQAARLLLTVTPPDNIGAVFNEAKLLIENAVDFAFPHAVYKLSTEKQKLNSAIEKADELVCIEEERVINANKTTQIMAMDNSRTLESSRDITLQTLNKNHILDHRNIETILRGFPQS